MAENKEKRPLSIEEKKARMAAIQEKKAKAAGKGNKVPKKIKTQTINIHQQQGAEQSSSSAPKDEDVNPEDVKTVLENCFESYLTPERESIRITNDDNRNIRGRRVYSVKVCRDKIDFVISTETKKDKYIYTFENGELQHNDQKQESRFLKLFLEKLQHIGQDICNNKAAVFEELKKKGA